MLASGVVLLGQIGTEEYIVIYMIAILTGLWTNDVTTELELEFIMPVLQDFGIESTISSFFLLFYSCCLRYQLNISHDSWPRNNQTLCGLQCFGGENKLN